MSNIKELLAQNRVGFLFDEFCLWRSRVFTGYRHVACDDNSNRLRKEIEGEGYLVIYSLDPASDGYYYALVKDTGAELYENESVILKDTELGYDLSNDPEHYDEWHKGDK